MPRRTNSLFTACTLVVAAGLGGWVGWRVSPFLGVGLFLTAAAWAAWPSWHLSRRGRRCAAIALLGTGLPALFTGLYQVRCWYQRRPDPVQRPLFQGVDYIREVLPDPDAAVVHLLKVDLSVPGVRVLITPPDFPDRLEAVRARTTSQFVAEFGLQAAINGNNFFPFERHNPWSYWPYAHELKGIVGGAASDGVPYGEPSQYYPVLHIAPDNHAAIVHNLPRPWHTATAGIKHFIIDGVPIHMTAGAPEATTAVGIDETGTVLFLVVVDGDQPPYATGIDRPSLTALLLRYGVHNALGLDGGGSSTLVISDESGQPLLLNRPVQGGVPGIERPVGNHIGIYAPALDNSRRPSDL
jgi:hypothetical protein